jgi:hypothetical protein
MTTRTSSTAGSSTMWLLAARGRGVLAVCGMWALLPVAPVAAQQQATTQLPSASGIYTCVDGKGRRLTSDRPIAECNDREQKVLNPSGTVQKQVGPTLTAAEKQALEEREQRQREEQARKDEDKRRERALLVRYPNQVMHDKERSEAIDQIAAVRHAAQKRLAELQEQRKKLSDEMDFYKKDPSKAPPSLRRQVDEVAQSLQVQDRFIREQDNEVKRVNARFDEELVRLKDLWKLRTVVPPGAHQSVAPANNPTVGQSVTPKK